MENEFDGPAWAETLMTDESATRFVEEAVFQEILTSLKIRDKTYWREGISPSDSVRNAWNQQKMLQAFDVFDRVMEIFSWESL